jgi:hypothetical protein
MNMKEPDAGGGKRALKKNAACMPEMSKITVLPDTAL